VKHREFIDIYNGHIPARRTREGTKINGKWISLVHFMVPFASMLRGNPLSCRGNPSGYLKTAAQRDGPIQQVYHSNGDDASCRKTPAV